MRVLFITSNRIGDAVLSTGLLRHVIATHPRARVTIACGPVAAPLFRAVPGLDRVAVLRKQPLARHWLALWRASVGVRWDWVIDLRNSAVSRLVWAARRSIFHPAAGMVHKVEELAAVLGLSPPPAPGLWIDAEARSVADRLLPSDGAPLLALGPTANWLSKEWPADRFAAVARTLTAAGGPLAGGRVAVLAAGGAEAERARPVLAALGPAGVDLTGRTDPLAAAACLERAALYIGNDSGLMHIAAAVGTPTLGLFGPGYPERYAPWGPRARVVTGSIPRDALLARLKAAGLAPIPLMQGIAVSNVEEAAVSLLRDAGGAVPAPVSMLNHNPHEV
ncbi:lipopolysaccharide export system permease protein [Azospirillum fermentarium]|uniref:glycosyltransferase family 9 protein n=1 Tax=Azospirillum fermentarium TaxID=1233114 RepID=UPI002226C246|nr:glycosyltransferase family 9 protein [Azospirillum fermentarium]MCW2248173.1 lipopolysaccharide export system permease protein [Azospirillum fermentarium]